MGQNQMKAVVQSVLHVFFRSRRIGSANMVRTEAHDQCGSVFKLTWPGQ